MPNWCNNDITLTHKDPAMIQRAQEALARGEFLSEFLPVPAELQIVAGRVGGDEDPEQIKLMEAEQRNLEKYGARNWYDWSIANWGTKWDVGGDDGLTQRIDENTLQASFDSAWSPPIGAYEKLTELGFEIKAYYNETGMCFCGVWEDGCDDYYEYGGETSATVREVIGEELDDYYSISESMAEYEEMEEE